ncbi:Amidohydro-rel domain-containing protein, partial [Trichostrongylus colubriformis]
MPILIKNGTVVNDDEMFLADVLIEGETIAEVAGKIEPTSPDTVVLDAHEMMVIPGGLDPHTHMQFPFMGTVSVDDFYTGTRAALAGGTTMIIDFVVPNKDDSPIEAYRQWREWADPK